MVSDDHVTFTDDGQAWLAVSADPDEYGWAVALDRPCDHCGALVRAGDQVIDTEGRRWVNGRSVARYEPFRCPDCIDGRHTFDIEVGRDVPVPVGNPQTDGWRITTYRVAVVPGTVERQEDGTWRVQLKVQQQPRDSSTVEP